jgi:hypothetical protein
MKKSLHYVHCHLCLSAPMCHSVPGGRSFCIDYRRHWFRSKLDFFLGRYEWYRRRTGGAWFSYWVDMVAGIIYEPAEGSRIPPFFAHAVHKEYWPPARPPQNKWVDLDL